MGAAPVFFCRCGALFRRRAFRSGCFARVFFPGCGTASIGSGQPSGQGCSRGGLLSERLRACGAANCLSCAGRAVAVLSGGVPGMEVRDGLWRTAFRMVVGVWCGATAFFAPGVRRGGCSFPGVVRGVGDADAVAAGNFFGCEAFYLKKRGISLRMRCVVWTCVAGGESRCVVRKVRRPTPAL